MFVSLKSKRNGMVCERIINTDNILFVEPENENWQIIYFNTTRQDKFIKVWANYTQEQMETLLNEK